MNKHCLILVGLLAGAAQALTPEDTVQISAAFASTNSPQRVIDLLQPIYTNVWFNLSKNDPMRGREVQYNILTNLISFKSQDVDYWLEGGLSNRRRLFYRVFTFVPSTNDVAYLNLCADYLGQKMNPIEYEVDLRSGGYSWYNKEIVSSKSLLVREFAGLVTKFESQLPIEERATFRSNILERARLEGEDARIVFEEGRGICPRCD